MSSLAAILAGLERAGELVERPATLPTVTGVTDDSRRVRPGMLFCATRGTVSDGHDFLPAAAEAGAAAALVTRPTGVAIPTIVVRDARRAAAVAAATWFGRPADGMTVVGVTGTNGKSTTVALIRHVLNREGNVGALGTLGGVDGAGDPLPDDAGLTTPGAVHLQAALATLAARGSVAVVMEVSSHALDQHRVAEVPFRGAVFTNFTRDHLDYHADETAYLDAKARLAQLLVDGGVEVVNADDPAWSALPRRAATRRITYGVAPDADVGARDVRCTLDGAAFTASFDGRETGVRVPLLGEFNVHNALAAAATSWGLGEDPEEIADALAQAPQIAGRMERLGTDRYTIIRDYAHTPDALERALRALRPLTAGRLVVVFGAGGDRDRGKRPLMGGIAAREADLAIVTSDNPRTESPDRIIDDIETGMGGVDHVRIVDRRAAIHDAIGRLATGDCLLLAGKGHETYQVIGTEKRPFDERDIVRDALGEPAA